MEEIDYDELCFALLPKSFWMVSKNITKYLKSGDTAIFLSLLMSKYQYFKGEKGTKGLTPDGFFYAKIDDVEEETGFSRAIQDNSIKRLKENNLILMEVRTKQTLRYFKILTKNVYPLLINNNRECRKQAIVEKSTTSNTETNNEGEKTVGHDCKKLAIANVRNSQTNIITNNKNKSLLSTSYLQNPTTLDLADKNLKPLNKGETTLVKKPAIRKNTKLVIEDPDGPLHPLKPYIKKSCNKINIPKKSKETEEILQYWRSKGFSIHRENCDSYGIAINRINALLDGTLFANFKDKGGVRKYSVNEVKHSIDNFALAAYNIDYEPNKPVIKEHYQRTPLCNFFYDLTKGDDKDKSKFLHFFFNTPKKISEAKYFLAKDEMPRTTKIILDWYINKFANKGKITIQDKNKIIFCTRALKDFFEKNSIKLNISSEWKREYGQENEINFLAVQLTRALDKELRNNESLYENFGLSWLASEKTLNERLPNFLKSERIMK